MRRGTPLQATPCETFPGTGPRKCIRYCKYGMPGACAGEFLLGADEELAISNEQLAMNNEQ